MLFALALLFRIVLTFIILWIKMSIYKNLLSSSGSYHCLSLPAWLCVVTWTNLFSSSRSKWNFLNLSLWDITKGITHGASFLPTVPAVICSVSYCQGLQRVLQVIHKSSFTQKKWNPPWLAYSQNYVSCNVYSINCIVYTCGFYSLYKSL